MSFTPKIEWSVFVDPDDEEQIPHLVVKQGATQCRIATREECERAVRLLNEEGSSVIRLLCKNPLCKGVGSWIERSRKDAEKNMYFCEECHKPMER